MQAVAAAALTEHDARPHNRYDPHALNRLRARAGYTRGALASHVTVQSKCWGRHAWSAGPTLASFSSAWPFFRGTGVARNGWSY